MKAIIILGCRIVMNDNGEYKPSDMLKSRLDKAYDTYVSLGTKEIIIIVSGGAPSGSPITESRVMSQYLLNVKKIPACKIFEENRSTNTIENCLLSYQLLDDLIRRRLCIQQIIQGSNCNYSDSDVEGEISDFDDLTIVTSEFHVPRSKKIFEHYNTQGKTLQFVSSTTPADELERRLLNEQRINLTLDDCLN